MSEQPILTARLDRADVLTHADDAFAALDARAGGAIGRTLAVPQLATIVRLARRLQIRVSRAVTIADGDMDVDCWVRATPDDEGVSLTVSPLRERPAWRAPAPALTIADVPAPPGADWVWETDAALRVTRIPIEAGAQHGFDAAAALGEPLTRLFALDGGGDGILPMLEAVAARQDFDRQAAVLRGSGQRVTLAATARRDASGEFGGFVGGTFLENDAPAPATGLAQAFSSRLDTILRGPLGRIIANADSINAAADGPLDAHYADYAADIASAGRHLMGLVDDLVDLEAIEREDFAVECEPLDLVDVARRAAGLLAVRAADAGVTIARPAAEVPFMAHAEFRRTLQILVNLITNALRYSPRGASVTVGARRQGDRIAVSVSDVGKGIAPADQARIFGKFERIDASEPGGNGLGLYIARRLARAMGGDLTVASAPGEGACFTLTLPAHL